MVEVELKVRQTSTIIIIIIIIIIIKKRKEKKVLFVNLSMGACGVVGKGSGKLFSMLKELGMNEMESHFLIRKLMNVCIRSTYFIFCKREKAWEGLDLLVW